MQARSMELEGKTESVYRPIKRVVPVTINGRDAEFTLKSLQDGFTREHTRGFGSMVVDCAALVSASLGRGAEEGLFEGPRLHSNSIPLYR